MTNGVSAQRRTDGALFKISDRGGKRAGAQDEREVVGIILAEVAFDEAGVVDAALDDRGGVDMVLEHDSHLAAGVLFGEGTKAARGFRRKREIDLPLARII